MFFGVQEKPNFFATILKFLKRNVKRRRRRRRKELISQAIKY